MTDTLRQMQLDVAAWSYKHRWKRYLDQLGQDVGRDFTLLLCSTGLAEEVGELERCVTKMVEGIRGSRHEWINEAEKKVGDVLIRVLEVCELLGIDADHALLDRFDTIRHRPLDHDPIGGAS